MSVDARAEIEALVAFEGRVAGSDAERRAAGHLARRLEALGREAELEPTVVLPRAALTHAIHAAVSIAGSVASAFSAPLGAALALLAALSAYGDLTGRFFLLRRLTGRRASQNVVSEEGGEKPGLIVLLAHHDAARTSGLFRPRSVDRRARIGERIGRSFGLLELLFYAQLAVLACCLLQLPVQGAIWLGLIQLLPTTALIVGVPLALEVAAGAPVPGANDNASGVATVLRVLESHGERLESFDLWAVFPGAEEAQALGMRAWLRRHRGELDRARTLFIDLDKVGSGTVRFARREGLVLPLAYDARLLELCREIAAADAAEAEPFYSAREYVARTAGDAAAARSKGYSAVSLACLDERDLMPRYHSPGDTPEQIEDDALERAYEFCCELIERIDEELGPELETTPTEEVE